jgi:1-acylglycerone phosphate reductase
VSFVAVLLFHAAYKASEAAISMFSNSHRLELEPFGVTVVDLKTGVVTSNLTKNTKEWTQATLSQGSIYEPVKEAVEKAMRSDGFKDSGMPAQQWAELIVQGLLRKRPLPNVWRGEQAYLARIGTVLTFGMLDASIKKTTGIDTVEQIVRK